MVDEVPMARRELLAAGGLAIGFAAGCTDTDSASEELQVGYGGVPATRDLQPSGEDDGSDGEDSRDDGSERGSRGPRGGSSDGGGGAVVLPGGGSSLSPGSDGSFGSVGYGEGPYGGAVAAGSGDGQS